MYVHTYDPGVPIKFPDWLERETIIRIRRGYLLLRIVTENREFEDDTGKLTDGWILLKELKPLDRGYFGMTTDEK